MSDMQGDETLSLIHSHARIIAVWCLDSCDPMRILDQEKELRSRAERLNALVMALVGPAPTLRKPKVPKSARLPKRKPARRNR